MFCALPLVAFCFLLLQVRESLAKELDNQDLATAIEEQLFCLHGKTALTNKDLKGDYRNKYTDIRANLHDNTQLKESVLSGKIQPSVLCRMSTAVCFSNSTTTSFARGQFVW